MDTDSKNFEGEFYILHFNDVYDIEEQQREPKGGIARFLTIVRSLQQKYSQNIITLFSGDLFSPSSLSTIYNGTQMLYPIQELKVDVACLGNHDFDFLLPQVQQLMQSSQIPWLLSNVYNSENGRNLADALPYFIKEVALRPSGQLKIGFIGLAEEEWLHQISEVPQHIIQYEDYVHCAERLTRFLRNEENCQFIIALTHMRIPNDQKLIKMLPAGTIDLVLGGHDHVWYKEKIGQTFYLKSGTNFRNLGLLRVHLFQKDKQINIDWVNEVETQMKQTTSIAKLYRSLDDPKEYVSFFDPVHNYHLKNSFSELNTDVTLIPLNIVESVPQEPEMSKYVHEKVEKYNLGNKLSKKYLVETLKTIGFSDVNLETRFEKVRCQECNFTSFYADLLRAEFQTDVCVLNSGTIRADELLEAGPITYQTINKIFAIPDVLVTYRINGEKLHKTLENGQIIINYQNSKRVSKYPSYDGRFLAMSGIRIKFDPNQKEGQRILKEDIIINGSAIDYERIYTMVTKLYVASGYDGFTEIPAEDFMMDKAAGIPVSQIFQTFFETVRKSQMIRKISSQIEEEELQDGRQLMEKIQEQLEQQEDKEKTIFDLRYQKFLHIVKEVRTIENEPYIVISPQIDGRIQLKNQNQ